MAFYYRTYFDKDTVISNDSLLNLGANPVANLFYGGGLSDRKYSRYLFHFDESEIINKYNQCKFDLTKTKHFLNLKLTFFFGDDKRNLKIPSSFNFCLYKIMQDWTEGCGYDYECEACDGIVFNECGKQNGAANWYYAKENIEWGEYGAINTLTGDTIPLYCKDFDCRQVDYLKIDITDEINDIITGDTVNYGYMLAFNPDLEHYEITEEIHHIGLYSRETNTYFEPFVESISNVQIKDDRDSFYPLTNNNLYLHTYIHNQLTALDFPPNVEIYDESNTFVLSGESNCVDVGIYEFSLNLSGATQDCSFFSDKWTNLFLNNVSLPAVTNEFEIKENEEMYNFNNLITSSKEFRFKFRGVNYQEKIKRGDIRKIFIDIAPKHYPNKKLDFTNAYFKIYVQDGADKLELHDWMYFNLSFCENWFELDTTWMIPQEYYIDVLVEDAGEKRTFEKIVKFTIIE